MAKQLMHSEDARKKILGGIQSPPTRLRSLWAQPVKSLSSKRASVHRTSPKTVSQLKEHELSDPFENMGAQLEK